MPGLSWLLLATLLFIFHKIHGHYDEVRKLLRIDPNETHDVMRNQVVILVQSLHAGTLKSIEYASLNLTALRGSLCRSRASVDSIGGRELEKIRAGHSSGQTSIAI